MIRIWLPPPAPFTAAVALASFHTINSGQIIFSNLKVIYASCIPPPFIEKLFRQ